MMDPVTSAVLLVKMLHDKAAGVVPAPQPAGSVSSLLLKSLLLPALVSLFGGLAGFLLLELIVKPHLRPKLKVEFDEKIPGCMARRPSWHVPSQKPVDAVYARIRVSNVRGLVAKNARTFLYDVEWKDTDGAFKPTEYCDFLPLSWAFESADEERKRPKTEGISLLRNAADYVDICAAYVTDHELHSGLLYQPTLYADLFKRYGTYRLSIVVTAEDAQPVYRQMLIQDWDGDYQKLKVVSAQRKAPGSDI
jgi:hypothetical protein